MQPVRKLVWYFQCTGTQGTPSPGNSEKGGPMQGSTQTGLETNAHLGLHIEKAVLPLYSRQHCRFVASIGQPPLRDPLQDGCNHACASFRVKCLTMQLHRRGQGSREYQPLNLGAAS